MTTENVNKQAEENLIRFTDDFSEKHKEIFAEMNSLNVNKYVEEKRSGGQLLSYLSWASAWKITKKIYPTATYEIQRYRDNLPYVYDPVTGYMVSTTVTIEGLTYEMWLPVLDGANKAMKSESYTYMTKKNGEKSVEVASMADINKAIMRCLVKNLSLFGIGLYIYEGEDFPEAPIATKEQLDTLRADFKEMATLKKRSEKTIENQTLAHFKYAGKLSELTVDQCEAIKEWIEGHLTSMKIALENTTSTEDV